jgi:hypothetical protein
LLLPRTTSGHKQTFLAQEEHIGRRGEPQRRHEKLTTPRRSESLRRVAIDLVGTWRLLAWRRTVDGAVSYPLGENAEGVLIYTPDGRMAVTLTAASRPALPENDPLGGPVEDRAAAYSGCLAYIGTYELRETEVVHRIELSLYPPWAGAEQVRPFTYTGDELVLHTPPAQTPAGTVANELAWARERS